MAQPQALFLLWENFCPALRPHQEEPHSLQSPEESTLLFDFTRLPSSEEVPSDAGEGAQGDVTPNLPHPAAGDIPSLTD